MDTVVAPKGSTYWYILTPEQVRAMEEHDVATGNRLDSAGEPRLYSRVSGGRFPADTVVTITKRRGVEWPTWNRKPKYLCEGLATIDGIPRTILVQSLSSTW